MRTLGLDHINIHVRDVDASVRFYCDLLGLLPVGLEEFRRGLLPYPGVRLSEQTVLGLVPTAAAAGEGLACLSLEVEPTELVAVAARLREEGVTVESDLRRRHGARGRGVSLVVHDPDGHRVELRYY